MDNLTLICPAKVDPVFADPEFADATEALASDPGSGRPFMISYDIFISGEDVYCQPDVRVWLEIDGRIGVLALGAQNPELSREFAPQAFELLAWDGFRHACEYALAEMINDARGETYHICLSRHGVLIAADELHAHAYHYGQDTVICALMPDSTSNHQAFERIAGLQRCADALMALESASAAQVRSSEIRVKQA